MSYVGTRAIYGLSMAVFISFIGQNLEPRRVCSNEREESEPLWILDLRAHRPGIDLNNKGDFPSRESFGWIRDQFGTRVP